jgi:thioredoxin 1
MAKRLVTMALCTSLAMAAALTAEEGQAERRTVEAAYPGLLNGVLSSATVGQLPDGVLVDLGGKQITQPQLDAILARAPAKLKEQLAKNALFLAQDVATPELLLRAAREWAAAEQKDTEGKAESGIISDYLQSVAADVSVSDTEVREFYEGNKDMFSGAKLDDVKEPLRQYLRKTKRQEKVDRHIAGLGGKYGVVISASWLEAQAPLARDNPVDKARASGKPTMVDFGSTGCTPCDMMAPILKTLEAKYATKANVIFVHVGENQVLAARYGVSTIPLQVFFDKDGWEVYRHTGFFPQDKIEERLGAMGVK